MEQVFVPTARLAHSLPSRATHGGSLTRVHSLRMRWSAVDTVDTVDTGLMLGTVARCALRPAPRNHGPPAEEVEGHWSSGLS